MSNKTKRIIFIVIGLLVIIAFLYKKTGFVIKKGDDVVKKVITLSDDDMVEETIDLKEFSKLTIDYSSVDITIEKSVSANGYSISYCLPEVQLPRVSYQGKTCMIDEPSNISLQLNLNHKDRYLKITVPSGADDYDVEIKSSSGDVTVNSVNINGKIDTISGDIYLLAVNSKSSEIITSSGDVTVSESTLDNGKLETTSGNIEIDNSSSSKFTVRSSSGDIVLCDDQFGDIYVNTTSGNTEIEESRLKYLEHRSTSGDLEIRDSELGSISSDSTSGFAEIELDDDIKNYNYSITTTSGSIEVGGIDAKREYEENNHAGNNIRISRTSGKVKIKK